MTTRRRATYPAARRIARLLYELPAHPHGWSFDDIKQRLAIGERTLLRYVEACRSELVDPDGQPLIQVVQREQRRLLRLRDAAASPDAAALSAVSILFSLAMARALDGAEPRAHADAPRNRLLEQLPESLRAQLANLDRKFYAASLVAGDDASQAHAVAEIVQALVREYRLSIAYERSPDETEQHDLEPYTLLAQRGALYLIGHSHQLGGVTWLALERIRRVEPASGDDAQGRATFTYPDAATFHPERCLDGRFGIADGPPTEVEIALLDDRLASELRARSLHPSQRVEHGAHGRPHLVMTVRRTDEVASWAMSVAPSAEILRPATLRDEVARRLAAASARYARGDAA